MKTGLYDNLDSHRNSEREKMRLAFLASSFVRDQFSMLIFDFIQFRKSFSCFILFFLSFSEKHSTNVFFCYSKKSMREKLMCGILYY